MAITLAYLIEPFWAELSLLILAVGAAVLLVLLLRVWRAIGQLRLAAQRLARGNLARRINVSGPLQLTALAESMDQMAGQLQDRLSTVVQHRNELGAVLSSMVEGVVAIDLDESIISLNRAAAELLGMDPAWAIGRSIQEAFRNTALQAFVGQTLERNVPRQTEVTLRPAGDLARQERCVQAQSAILRDAAGARIGVVIVLHDVTQLRRLEQVRRDFVANVSHEVKTPVSAIKAAVEMLLDDQPLDPHDASRMLKIVERQAGRLGAIVDDLLSLARLEQGRDQILADLATGSIASVLHAAAETCQAKAAEKRIRLEVACPSELSARMNAHLLEQAMVNLMDNAIKYSPEDTAVHIAAQQADGEIVITVQDTGRGIEPEHLPRIFERFYRTDKARSRSLGGTGLGLSIVKHVAEAHGGRVSVQSTVGQGSAFLIHLLPAVAEVEANEQEEPQRRKLRGKP